ncbi:hypothetical protein ANTQUA_LOCUS5039 [Anthophora quadrimaculata]
MFAKARKSNGKKPFASVVPVRNDKTTAAPTSFRFYTKTVSVFCSSVKTDMGASSAISRLYIANANKKDSGNYSCALADVAAATTVSVHVLNGENPAAMQHGSSAGLRATFVFIVIATLLSSFLR